MWRSSRSASRRRRSCVATTSAPGQPRVRPRATSSDGDVEVVRRLVEQQAPSRGAAPGRPAPRACARPATASPPVARPRRRRARTRRAPSRAGVVEARELAHPAASGVVAGERGARLPELRRHGAGRHPAPPGAAPGRRRARRAPSTCRCRSGPASSTRSPCRPRSSGPSVSRRAAATAPSSATTAPLRRSAAVNSQRSGAPPTARRAPRCAPRGAHDCGAASAALGARADPLAGVFVAVGRPGRDAAQSRPPAARPRARPLQLRRAGRPRARVGGVRARRAASRSARRPPSRRRSGSPRQCAGSSARTRRRRRRAARGRGRRRPGAGAPDQLAQAVQPVGVEVVGRLVEQDDVEAPGAERREPGARRLPAAQRRERPVELRGVESDLGGGVASRASASAPPSATQRSTAAACGSIASSTPASSRAVSKSSVACRRRDADRSDRLADGARGRRLGLGELRQVADGAVAHQVPPSGARARRGSAAASTCRRRWARRALSGWAPDAQVDRVEDGARSVISGDAAREQQGG